MGVYIWAVLGVFAVAATVTVAAILGHADAVLLGQFFVLAGLVVSFIDRQHKHSVVVEKQDKNEVISTAAAVSASHASSAIDKAPSIVINALENGLGQSIANKAAAAVKIDAEEAAVKVADKVAEVVKDAKDQVIAKAAEEVIAFTKSGERAKIFAEGVVEGRRQRDSELAMKAAETDLQIPIARKKE